jgi:outer membrane protein OmpA-like peptidoglycan-associated protein
MRTSYCSFFALAVLLSTGSVARAEKRAAGRTPARVVGGGGLQIWIDKVKAQADLPLHRLELKLSHPVDKISLKVTGESGAVLADEEQDFRGRPAGVPVMLTWQPSSDESVMRVEVRATDTQGRYVGVALTPWQVRVPHEDVNFRTDSADIDAGELGKLDDAYQRLVEILAGIKTHHNEEEFRSLTLFISGHTDTVGSTASNLRLSQARARAIAAWFRGKGVRIPIAYEGFGETSLRVSTADQVDEPRNRRSDYIVSPDEPYFKTTGFRPVWKRVP